MSLDRPHHPDSVYSPHVFSLGRQQPGSPDLSLGKPSVPKLGLSTLGKSGKPPPSTSIENNMQSSFFSKTEEFVRRIWAPPQESGPPSGISDVTTDLRTGSNSDEFGEFREANRIAARVTAAVEHVVAREPNEDPALVRDKFVVLLVERDGNARLVTLDVSGLQSLTIQQRVKLAASKEIQVEPRSIQIYDANDNLLVSNSETYRALADTSSMPLKAVVNRSPFVSQDDVNIADCSAVSDVLLGSEPACDCEIGMPEPTDFTHQIKFDRLIALEQRLEATVSHIIGEIAQEKRVRQSVCEALTERLDSMAGGPHGKVCSAGIMDKDCDVAQICRDAGDKVLAICEEHMGRAPGIRVETSSDRQAVLPVGSDRTGRPASDDIQDQNSVMTICNELAGRLCKVEHESESHRCHVVELEAARVADSLRLHSLCEAHSAELQSQCASLKVQAECLSTAIDGILQWVKEGEPTGFIAVLERLALGGKLDEGTTFESSNMRSQLLAVRSAVEKRRAANRAGVVSQPPIDNRVSISKVEVPAVEKPQSWTPIVQSRVLHATTPSSTCGESGKLAMPPVATAFGRSQSLEVPNASKSSLRTIQGQMRASSPFQVQRLNASRSRDSSAPRELIATTPPRPSSHSPDCRTSIRSRSPASHYRHNSYVTNVNALSSQSSISANVTSLQSAVTQTQSPTSYLRTTVQPSPNPPSPTLSSATSVMSALGNATVGIGLGFGLQESLPAMSRATMPVSRVTQQSQPLNGSQQITAVQTISSSMKLETGSRSVSPPRTRRVDGSPKGAAPPQERVSRPFRRLISNSIGIGSEC